MRSGQKEIFHNVNRIEIQPNVIPSMIQLTPTNYWRHNIDKFGNQIDDLEQMESQMYAEFLGYSDFNKLTKEKYIKIV